MIYFTNLHQNKGKLQILYVFFPLVFKTESSNCFFFFFDKSESSNFYCKTLILLQQKYVVCSRTSLWHSGLLLCIWDATFLELCVTSTTTTKLVPKFRVSYGFLIDLVGLATDFMCDLKGLISFRFFL